jgi:hypothetical protein
VRRDLIRIAATTATEKEEALDEENEPYWPTQVIRNGIRKRKKRKEGVLGSLSDNAMVVFLANGDKYLAPF